MLTRSLCNETILAGSSICEFPSSGELSGKCVDHAHVHVHVHPGRLSDNLLVKKMVTHLAASLARTPGKRCSKQNRLPLLSTHGQSQTPNFALLSPNGEHIFHFCPADF